MVRVIYYKFPAGSQFWNITIVSLCMILVTFNFNMQSINKNKKEVLCVYIYNNVIIKIKVLYQKYIFKIVSEIYGQVDP